MSKLRKHKQPWTKEEVDEIRSMLRLGKRWAVIAEYLGRTVPACTEALRLANLSAEQAALRKQQKYKSYTSIPEHCEDCHLPSYSRVPPDPDALAERDRALLAGWRDYTAWHQGDPPIGRSALDRKETTNA